MSDAIRSLWRWLRGVKPVPVQDNSSAWLAEMWAEGLLEDVFYECRLLFPAPPPLPWWRKLPWWRVKEADFSDTMLISDDNRVDIRLVPTIKEQDRE